MDGATSASLLNSLRRLDAAALAEEAVATLAAKRSVFPPDTILVPALVALHQQHGAPIAAEPAFSRLWQQAAEFLLARSEFPPVPPTDWAQPAKLDCRCPDCRALAEFLADPQARTRRFPMAKERRRHLHQVIDRNKLDLTHETERRGSPQTLVCTKTRRSFEQRCKQYTGDVSAPKALLGVAGGLPQPQRRLVGRLRQAIARSISFDQG